MNPVVANLGWPPFPEVPTKVGTYQGRLVNRRVLMAVYQGRA